MMGKDIEKLLSEVDQLAPKVIGVIESLCSAIAPNTSMGSINPMPDVYTPVAQYWSTIESDLKRFETIKNKMFVNENQFFNSIGSPFREYDNMKKAYDKAKSYASSHSSFTYWSEKNAFIPYLQILLTSIYHFETMLVQFSDYLQRGYDTVFNDNISSITIQRSKNDKTNGNITQKSNNASVKKKNNNPY